MKAQEPKVHPQLARLFEIALGVAQSNLARSEMLLPGYLGVDPAGKLILGVAARGGSEGSNLLVVALREKAAAGEVRAVAIYRDVRLRPRAASEDVDGIQVVAELASGEAAHLLQVYFRSGAGQLVMGQSEIVPAPAVIFKDAPGGATPLRS